jgi:hypothetical protein
VGRALGHRPLTQAPAWLRLLDDPRTETTAKWAERPTMRWSIPTLCGFYREGILPGLVSIPLQGVDSDGHDEQILDSYPPEGDPEALHRAMKVWRARRERGEF